MAKKKTTKRATAKPAKKAGKPTKAGHSKRLDPADFGIDLRAILDEIKPHLSGMTQAEIGEAAGLSAMVVSHLVSQGKPPSLGAVASLAAVSGGRLIVKYEPPRSRRTGK